MAELSKRRYPNQPYSFVTLTGKTDEEGGKKFNTSRVSREFRSIWKSTGIYEKYGVYNATRNRKRIATVMAETNPELSLSVAK